MKLFLKNYLLLVLLSLLTLFSCVEEGTTDSNNPPTTPPTTPPAPSLAINYGISGNFYIALTNTPLELIQKTDFGSQSNFSISPPLPNGLSIGIISGSISGTPTTISLPTTYTITAIANSKTYTNIISLGVAPSITWVTDTNSLNPYQLTSYVVGDRSKQISDWTWSSSDRSLATVTNGMIGFESTTNRRTVLISAVKDNYSNGMSFTVDKVEVVNGEKIITKGTDVSLIISSETKTIATDQFENQDLTSLIIPNSVTSIGSGAFYQNQLKSVVIGNSVTTIGKWAFQNNQLTNVVIGNSVTTIGGSAFFRNQLTNVVIPNSVTYIGSSAFRGSQLTNVVIGNSVTYIHNAAFMQNQLRSVVLPDSLTNTGTVAFSQNSNLGEVSLKQSLYNKLLFNRKTIFGYQVTNYIRRP